MVGLTRITRSPLRLPAFRRFWLGRSISLLGDQFTAIALLWFVLQLTGSGVAVGTVLLCFGLPGILASSALGNLLDRYQPRLIIGVDNACRALIIGAIPALHWLGLLHLWMIYILSAAVVIGLSRIACVATGVAGLLSPMLRAVRRPGHDK